MNQHQRALVDLHHLLDRADGADADWLDWSRGSLARLPQELVEVCNNGPDGHRACSRVNGRVLLELFGAGLILLGRPRLRGLVLTPEGMDMAERLLDAEVRA